MSLSHWGWGEAERFPDRAARGEQIGHAAAMLGFGLGEPEEPVPLDAIRLPKARVAAPAGLPIAGDDEARIRHCYGRAYPDLVRGFRGDFAAAPDLVASPSAEEDVVRVLEWAERERVAVIPFGGGTSVVGGVEARGLERVLSLDLRGLDRVLEVDPASRAARIQAGATGPVLEAQLAERGFTLRHYPQSYEHSTLGGWIATRAGGHYATLKTRIDDFVESARMITPRGPIETRRLPGSGAGPNPNALLLGSEGTLGVITEAWMRVTPKPRWRGKASVGFARFADALLATREIAQSGLHPANCRLLDPREAALHAIALDGRAVLLLGFESADHPIEAGLRRALEIARSAGGEIMDGPRLSEDQTEEAGRWRDAFFAMPYLQNLMVSAGVVADTFETACTWDRFDALHAAIVEAVLEAGRRVAGKLRLSCRFTHVYPDGPAPYYTFLAPARRGAELEQWAEIKAAASRAIVANGGTITHHHAVGRTHRSGYDAEVPELFRAGLRAFKAAVDPHGLMNPGVLLDPAPPSRPV